MTAASELLASEYKKNGYAVLKSAAPESVVRGMLGVISQNMMRQEVSEKFLVRPGPAKLTVNLKPSYEFHGNQFPMVTGFHWGLTSRMSEVSGKRLAPTYCFFRTYQKGDVCTVHSDREACEHSLSMPLSYSDGIIWGLDIGSRHFDPSVDAGIPPAPDFGEELFNSVRLEPGDALIYKGVNHRHGRTTPNPNRWSAHIFMHWVDLDGPYADWRFDRRPPPEPVEFSFPST